MPPEGNGVVTIRNGMKPTLIINAAQMEHGRLTI